MLAELRLKPVGAEQVAPNNGLSAQYSMLIDPIDSAELSAMLKLWLATALAAAELRLSDLAPIGTAKTLEIEITATVAAKTRSRRIA